MEPTFATTDDAHNFEVHRQQTRLVQFLMALRPDFEHVCGLLLHRSPLPFVDTALSELLAEEQTQFSLTKKKHVEPTHVLSANVSTPQNDRSFPPGTNDFCNYCKKKGHWKRDCPTRPQRPNNKNKQSGHQPNRGPMQSYSQRSYADNVTKNDNFVHLQMDLTSQIQATVDERMQQLFLASSTGSTSPTAPTPSASGFATTISGPSGTHDITWIFLFWCFLSYDK